MKERITLKKVKDCLNTIITNKNSKALNYCINYARYGRTIPEASEMKVQLLYVLNNMTHWRHPEAKLIRETFKQFIKEN